MAEPSLPTLSARMQGLTRMPAQQMFGLMLALAAGIALLVGGWMWGTAPDYRVLYSNLSDRDGGTIIASLQQMNVPYKFAEGGGALLVPASQVHEVRLRLASQGLPKGGLVGFELMENQKFGASQFQEQINYQRALEGELARSIQSLAAVQGARVHLALAKPSAFLREQSKSSASVLLNLYPGRSLEPAQVAAVTHLVSNSVPDLPARSVTVVDQNGNLLSGENNPTGKMALDPSQMKYRQDLEQTYVKRIEAILAPIIGPNNVRAQVAADLDFSETEQAEELYKPNPKPDAATIRSQQSSETAAAGSTIGGVPGALSNQPPVSSGGAASTAPAAASAATAGGASQPNLTTTPPPSAAAPSLRRDSTVNYEVDKSVRHTRQATGRIKRISVAVLINHRKVTDAAGKASQRPLSNPEREQISELVRGVVGFDKERGDSLAVMNSAFAAPEIEKAVDVPLWKQPQTIEVAKDTGKQLLIAGVVIYLLLFVLRPLLINLSRPPANASAELLPPEGEPRVLEERYEQRLHSAKQIAKQDPRMAANVVKEWVAGNER